MSVEERAAILTMHKLGMSRSEIAHRVPCSETSVSRWTTRWEDAHSLADSVRSGRPRCTSEQTDQAIQDSAEDKVNTTPRLVKSDLSLDCSARTIRRRLDEVGLFGRVRQEEHAYSDDTLRQRLTFAEGYSRWTEDEWARVMFSDETHFHLGQYGREYVQRPVGMGLDQSTKAKCRSGAASVRMAWATLSSTRTASTQRPINASSSSIWLSLRTPFGLADSGGSNRTTHRRILLARVENGSTTTALM